MASPASVASRTASSAGTAGPGLGRPDGGLDGLEDTAVVERVRDPGQPLLAQGGGALVEGLLERLGHRAPLLVEVDRARRRHDGPELTQPVVLPGGLRHRGSVLPVGESHRRQELVGHRQQGVGGGRGLAAGLGGGVLGVDGLAHGLQAAAQQLLGHGDLLGTQCRQHRVAVHGGRRCRGTLTAGRAAVAVAGPASARPARTPAPWPLAPVAAVAPVAAALLRCRAGCRDGHRGARRARRRRPAAASPSRGRGSPTRREPASGCPSPRSCLRPSPGSGRASPR